jgi:hypothetical protein
MTELIKVDLLGVYDDNDFDVDPLSVNVREFMDKGQKQKYFTASLKYRGQEPFFVVEGNSYGIQQGNENKDEEKGPEMSAPAGMVSLAPPKKEEDNKKEKWQISVIMTEKPAPKDWTREEAQRIEFLDNRLRRILANALSRHVDIVSKVVPSVIAAAQQKLIQEMQTTPQNFYHTDPNQIELLKASRFQAIISDVIYDKITKKVYRKKKEQKDGAQINFMDANAIYDETKYPTLYSSIQSYISKKTKKEEYVTKYYKGDKELLESEWKSLSHAEAVALGSHTVEVGVKFSDLFIGGNSTISIQLKAAEIVLYKPIQLGAMGHKGRLIVNTNPEVKRDQRLVTKSPIVAVGNNNNASQPTGQQIQMTEAFGTNLLQQQALQYQQQQAQQQYVANDQTAASNVFNPNTIAGIVPGIGGVQVVSHTGTQ